MPIASSIRFVYSARWRISVPSTDSLSVSTSGSPVRASRPPEHERGNVLRHDHDAQLVEERERLAGELLEPLGLFRREAIARKNIRVIALDALIAHVAARRVFAHAERPGPDRVKAEDRARF